MPTLLIYVSEKTHERLERWRLVNGDGRSITQLAEDAVEEEALRSDRDTPLEWPVEPTP